MRDLRTVNAKSDRFFGRDSSAVSWIPACAGTTDALMLGAKGEESGSPKFDTAQVIMRIPNAWLIS
jgi:hypothetical protein